MLMLESYRANRPNVIHEVIDGEAVIVNLENGKYYSIDKVGAAIWEHIENGLSGQEIVKAIAEKYEGSRTQIESGVSQLVSQLQQENLIISNGANENNMVAENGNTEKRSLSVGNGNSQKEVFEPPQLNIYNDMEELLLLDPIHDVDETGWPNAPAKKE